MSDTQLSCEVPDRFLILAGMAEITVFNPSPGGGLSNAVVFSVIPPGPGDQLPRGSVDVAVDAGDGDATLIQGSSLRVEGWAADPEDGAPVSRVEVLLDGASLGNATLGRPRPDVAAFFGRNDFLNSGWSLVSSLGTLAVGSHTVSAVAFDSANNSTPLGPQHTVTVTGGGGTNHPPLGFLDVAVDAADGDTTLPQGGTLRVAGWAADPENGAPVNRVEVRIDGVSWGNTTLGQQRPDVAAVFGRNDFLNSGWALTANIGSLAATTHTVTAVAFDVAEASATLGPQRTITVSTGGGTNRAPLGSVDVAVDVDFGDATVIQGGLALISGWAADEDTGAPVSRVAVLLNNNPVGDATLGLERRDVEAHFGRTDFRLSGWTFSLDTASLVPGDYSVTAVATDPDNNQTVLIQTLTLTVVTTPTIDSLGAASVAPFGTLVINGSGFDPLGRVSVRFFDQTGFSVEVPATRITSTSVRVAAPPYVDSTGAIASGVVNLEVTQAGHQLRHTIVVADTVTIEDLPIPGEAPGQFTLLFMNKLLQGLGETQAQLLAVEEETDGAITTAAQRAQTRAMIDQLTLVRDRFEAAGASQTDIILGQIDGAEMLLDGETLELAERLIAAFVIGISNAPLPGGSGLQNPLLVAPPRKAPAITAEELMELMRTGFLNLVSGDPAVTAEKTLAHIDAVDAWASHLDELGGTPSRRGLVTYAANFYTVPLAATAAWIVGFQSMVQLWRFGPQAMRHFAEPLVRMGVQTAWDQVDNRLRLTERELIARNVLALSPAGDEVDRIFDSVRDLPDHAADYLAKLVGVQADAFVTRLETRLTGVEIVNPFAVIRVGTTHQFNAIAKNTFGQEFATSCTAPFTPSGCMSLDWSSPDDLFGEIITVNNFGVVTAVDSGYRHVVARAFPDVISTPAAVLTGFVFSGTFSGSINQTIESAGGDCVYRHTITGTLFLVFGGTGTADDPYVGDARIPSAADQIVLLSGPSDCSAGFTSEGFGFGSVFGSSGTVEAGAFIHAVFGAGVFGAELEFTGGIISPDATTLTGTLTIRLSGAGFTISPFVLTAPP